GVGEQAMCGLDLAQPVLAVGPGPDPQIGIVREALVGRLDVVLTGVARDAEDLVGVERPGGDAAVVRAVGRRALGPRGFGLRRAGRLDLAHRVLRSLLWSRRHSSIWAWWPERSTSGTCQPRNSAGRV